MQSMEELRKICQKRNYKKVGNFMARNITRDQALYVTRFLLPTGISANQVTLLSMITGVCAALFFIPSNKWFFFTGALLLQLWYILDHVDGQIARYRNQSSLTGIFFDFISHHVINLAIFFCLGLRAYNEFHSVLFVSMGFIASSSIVLNNLIYDCKYKTFVAALAKEEGVIKIKHVAAGIEKAETKQNFMKKVYEFLHKLCEIHVIMNLISLMAVFNLFIGRINLIKLSVDLPVLFLLFYFVIAPLVAVSKLVFYVKNRMIDKDYAASFEAAEKVENTYVS